MISTIDLLRIKPRSQLARFFEDSSFRIGGRTMSKSKSSSRDPFPNDPIFLTDRRLVRNRSSRSRCERDRDRLKSQFRLQVVNTPNRVCRIVRIGNRCRCEDNERLFFRSCKNAKSNHSFRITCFENNDIGKSLLNCK